MGGAILCGCGFGLTLGREMASDGGYSGNKVRLGAGLNCPMHPSYFQASAGEYRRAFRINGRQQQSARRRTRQPAQTAPLAIPARRGLLAPFARAITSGGPGRARTADTAIFSRVLYQLSYRATGGAEEYRTARLRLYLRREKRKEEGRRGGAASEKSGFVAIRPRGLTFSDSILRAGPRSKGLSTAGFERFPVVGVGGGGGGSRVARCASAVRGIRPTGCAD